VFLVSVGGGFSGAFNIQTVLMVPRPIWARTLWKVAAAAYAARLPYVTFPMHVSHGLTPTATCWRRLRGSQGSRLKMRFCRWETPLRCPALHVGSPAFAGAAFAAQLQSV